MTNEIQPTQQKQTIEELTYKLIMLDRLPLEIVKTQLAKQGHTISKKGLIKLKQKMLRLADKELREEYLLDNMLESYERIKIEFEDATTRQKSYIEQFQDKGQMELAMNANKNLVDQSVIALKVMGKLNDKMSQIKANNLNVINVSDFSTAFKTMLRRWFKEMDAKVIGNQFVFQNPSPELLDDYYKWENEKNRKEIEGVIIDAESTNTSSNTI
jgi:hypothetical protein